MRTILFLTVVLFIWAQETVQSKQISDEVADAQNDVDLLLFINTSEEFTELRNLNDIKNKIKKSISVAWEIFKAVAKNTDIKLKAWVDKVKEKVNKLNKTFVERLDKLKNEFKNIVTKITITGDNVKACIKENKADIEGIFQEIISNMKTCITNNVNNFSNIEVSHVLLNIDDATFLDNVQKEIDETCKDDDENCLNKVQNEVISLIENASQNISEKHLEARDVIDDRLDDVVTCITESLTVAAKLVVNETVQIIQCVKNKN